MPHVNSKLTMVVIILIISAVHARAQVPVGAGSQLGQDYLRSREGKSTENKIRHSMIVSWVQGYVVGCAQRLTEEPAASEIADRIHRGDLPPDLDHVLSDPRVLAILQAKFGTLSGWVFDPPETKALEAWLTNYCDHHPSSRISEAADALVEELESKAKK